MDALGLPLHEGPMPLSQPHTSSVPEPLLPKHPGPEDQHWHYVPQEGSPVTLGHTGPLAAFRWVKEA